MNKFFETIKEGLEEALAYERGEIDLVETIYDDEKEPITVEFPDDLYEKLLKTHQELNPELTLDQFVEKILWEGLEREKNGNT